MLQTMARNLFEASKGLDDRRGNGGDHEEQDR
jgi:hypothetical protein